MVQNAHCSYDVMMMMMMVLWGDDDNSNNNNNNDDSKSNNDNNLFGSGITELNSRFDLPSSLQGQIWMLPIGTHDSLSIFIQ